MTKISNEIREWCDLCGGIIDSDDKAELHTLTDRIDNETVELPKDADDEYIHIGDVMEWCDSGETLTVEGIGSDVLFYIDGENAEWTAARNKRHHHEPTVEDVLYESLKHFGAVEERTPEVEEWLHEQAAKLRLADDGKEQQ